LGELQLPQSGLSPINRHPRGVLKGFQGLVLEGIERIEKEEEERRGNKAEALPNRDCDRPYIVSCSVFFTPVG